MQKHIVTIGVFAFMACIAVLAQFGVLDSYYISVLMFMGVNIMLATSLNLVNGYMGEFSCGHGGFMCVGAYVSSICTVLLFSKNAILGAPLLPGQLALVGFPLALLVGSVAAALAGLVVAIPSFKTRGDYLAIITLAANYIVISAINNMEIVGGPRGFMGMSATENGMKAVVDIPWMLIFVMLGTLFTVWLLRRFVSSTLGKGVPAICQDEIAAEIMSVDTNRMKLIAFMLSSGLAGLAGGLYAHILGYVNPQSFDIMRSTEIMVMVYLGGMGSLSGATLAAVLFTVLMEALRFLGVWKWVVIPLVLILLMQFRPEGLMGNKELSDLFPKLRKYYSFK
ncbi:amino acid/amide ABC transporter membrane protein 2, HAAT family [Humidesulfovibrio mexicanus]|uniref:Amino acid/amide ABC transporter membrane protein 2, HAAT family n=1 Tax=Humidesulfovibrio mexicanus TaxID=147047 RepID=A0A239D3W5_9BACT|nr:branched-chain amino acid ABC transporter permease [Humidesulfovibrio mexicanus]SNS26977.1 amino acid/amide ABC transporter membrane protein 2, HAAT family [Humidesulfovibrio mexicanus]